MRDSRAGYNTLASTISVIPQTQNSGNPNRSVLGKVAGVPKFQHTVRFG